MNGTDIIAGEREVIKMQIRECIGKYQCNDIPD